MRKAFSCHDVIIKPVLDTLQAIPWNCLLRHQSHFLRYCALEMCSFRGALFRCGTKVCCLPRCLLYFEATVYDAFLTVFSMKPWFNGYKIVAHLADTCDSDVYGGHVDSATVSGSHYADVIKSLLASQITSLTIVYSPVCSGTYERKHQSSASLAFVRGIHRGPVNSPHKWPVTRKLFPFDGVIMRFPSSQKMFCCHLGIRLRDN